jgi:hypothetical protein
MHHPEKERLGELAVAVGHAAGDIQHEEHHGVHRRLAPAGELAEAQILIGEGLRATQALAFHQLLDRTPAIQAGAGAAPVPAFAHPVAVVGRPNARLQVRQLHFLPQPVDDVVDLDLQHQLDATIALTALTFLRTLAGRTAIGQYVAGFRLALAHALGITRVEQPEMVVLQHPHRHPHGARRIIDHIAVGDDLRQVLTDGLAHLLVVPQPVAGPTREQVIPPRKPQGTGIIAVRSHVPCRPLLNRYSCARSVVT